MGNNPSKPTEYIFYGETPVQFSHNLLGALEGSSESDSTREKASDLHIAQLVHSELARLQSREDELLSQLSTAPTPASTTNGADPADALALSRDSLAQKVAEIKHRLENIPGGRGIAEEDDEVKRARGEVVNCLKERDRRPLDCWAEVQAFRDVARRREKGFVVGVIGR
ncbi:putative altered inheritance of mitochondria protein 13, mitochondrial [Tirmania nivea]|nr:putative altered inheritance of mitochondria protein 13, mitochondrial [Tirmania nivea]